MSFAIKPRYPNTAEGWLAYLLGAGVSEESSVALANWCAERPENRAEFELLSEGWELAGEFSSELEAPIVEVRNTWRRPRHLLVAAGLACLLFAALWLLRGLDQVSRYRTAQGEQRTVALGDGSRIVLNTATTMEFDASKQRASLLAGEAFFEVTPRKVRMGNIKPFSVDAGSATIQVLGTRFNVLREGENLLISVMEGRVRVDARSGSEQEGSSQEIGAGDVLEIQGGEPLIQPDGSALDRVKAWRQGKIELDRTPLDQAIEELSRYTPLPLVIAEPGLEELQVSGIFRIDRLGDLSSLRFALENSLPVRLRATVDRLELVSHSSSD